MMDAPVYITNAVGLKAEIARLKGLNTQQGIEIKQRFSSPSAIFSSVVSLFSGSSEGSKSGFFSQDIFGLLSRVLLPLTLNKTIFKNSNFLIKMLVSFISQKASHLVNEQSVTGAWNKVISLFDKKKPLDYGIPPESEAS